MSYFWGVYVRREEMIELQAWWDERKRQAWASGIAPVKWQPRGKLRHKRAKPKPIDSSVEQGYTADNTSLSSESPLPTPGQGVFTLKDKD